jgi:glycosyltransferase involved in cell wall biosynthesis
LFVLPSHSENFGIVVTEAMARMKPVVVTDRVQIAGHVTASQAGSVIHPNSGELAACMDSWLADSSRRRSAGELGRRYVGEQFTWPRAAERLASLYERLCHRSSS